MSILTEGRLGRYFFYAIGEIILLVAGILIALYLNNINQEKQQRQRELKMLGEIKSELAETILDLADDLEDHQRNLRSCEIIRDNLAFEQGYHDSLLVHFALTFDQEDHNPKTSAYQSLKSIGIDLISNDSLRVVITSLYELVIEDMEVEFSDVSENVRRLQSLMAPFWMVDSTLVGRTRYPLKLKSYDALLEDDRYLLSLVTYIPSRERQIVLYQRYIGFLEETIHHIEEEMARG